PRDEVHVRLVHPFEELPCVGAEALDVAPLPLGVDRVEDEARLPGPRRAGNDDELLFRDREVGVLDVVLPGALDDERVPGEAAGGAVAGPAVRLGHLRGAGGPLACGCFAGRLRHTFGRVERSANAPEGTKMRGDGESRVAPGPARGEGAGGTRRHGAPVR